MVATDVPDIADPTEPEAGGGLALHGTAVRWLGQGILLIGASASGKSDLALRLIEAGALLVADDLVTLAVEQGQLVARPYGPSGLIELRGQGVFRLPAEASAALALCLELLPEDAHAERLPPPRKQTFLGIALPCHRLDPRPASATARLRTLLSAERVW